jgi:hypothetical protein
MWGRTGARPSADVRVATNAPIPKKWGSKTTIYLNDGKGQGNNIAEFETYVDGICAQLDLWRTSANYKNKRFADAIAVWSGGNSVESYISFVLARVPGMTRNTIMNDDFWRGPMGLGFLKAQAWHEAGKQYPAPDADWIEAQKRVFSGAKASPVKTAANAGAGAVVVGTVAAGVQQGWGPEAWVIAGCLAAIGLAAFIYFKTRN